MFRVLSGTAFAGLMGAWLFRLNLQTDDTGILAGLILISSAVAAMILPRGWWAPASVIALSVITSEFVRSGEVVGRHIILVSAFVLVLSGAGIGTAAGFRLLLNGGTKNRAPA